MRKVRERERERKEVGERINSCAHRTCVKISAGLSPHIYWFIFNNNTYNPYVCMWEETRVENNNGNAIIVSHI